MSGCLKGTSKKYDRQIGFDMRGFILSLFMLNVLQTEQSLHADADKIGGGGPSNTTMALIPPKSATDTFSTSQVKTRHHRGERSLVKRSGDQLPEIISPGQVIRKELGQTAVLACSVQSLGKFVVMWKQDGRVISAGNLLVRKDDRLRLTVSSSDYNLHISSLSLEDASDYTCEVDIMGRPISIIHRLEVLVAPRIQCKDTKLTLSKGDNYTLRCSAQGQPNPRVSWSRRSGLSIPGSQSGSGLSLQLLSVDRQSEGEYVCTATNGVGQPAMAAIDVNVLYSPEVSLHQQYQHSAADKGITIKIDCVAHGNPSPQVTWYRDSVKLFETDRVLMTIKGSTWTIKLREVTASMFANYTCSASNNLGSLSQSTHVSGKPSKLRFTSPSLNHNLAHYNLTWSTESFSPITAYKLRFKVSKVENASEGAVSGRSGDWSEVAVPVPFISSFTSTWHYTFTNLQSSTVYDVVGMAKNEYGLGETSSTFTFYNKGIDYSTQQIKYKKPGKEMTSEGVNMKKNIKESSGNIEDKKENIFQGKLLIQDSRSAADISFVKGHVVVVFIVFSLCK